MDPQGVTLTLPVRSTTLRARLWVKAQSQPSYLSVVVVNYHNWSHTSHLVRQLRSSQAFRSGCADVVVIDNHTPMDREAKRLRRVRGVSIRRFGSNRGFARAVNEGERLSQGQWILLLNPDVTLPTDFLDDALAVSQRLEKQENATGIVGFRLENADGTHQLSTGRFPTLLSTLLGLIKPRQLRKYHEAPGDRPTSVDWATGCCLLVRRDCLEQLSGLDPNFFLYYEDVDLCRRARKAGWDVLFEPRLAVVHHHPLHSRQVPPHLRLITRHALLTYASKHWSRWEVQVLARIIRLEAWGRQWWARILGKRSIQKTFAILETICNDFLSQKPDRARKRLRQEVVREENNQGTIPVHRFSHSR